MLPHNQGYLGFPLKQSNTNNLSNMTYPVLFHRDAGGKLGPAFALYAATAAAWYGGIGKTSEKPPPLPSHAASGPISDLTTKSVPPTDVTYGDDAGNPAQYRLMLQLRPATPPSPEANKTVRPGWN